MKITGINTNAAGSVETIEAVTKDTVLFRVGDPQERKRRGTDDVYFQVRVTLADAKKNRFPVKYNFDDMAEAEALAQTFKDILAGAAPGTCPKIADGVELVGRVSPWSTDEGEANVAVSWTKDVPVAIDPDTEVPAEALGW